MGRQGTLAYWLVHMLSLVTGNLGVRGGNFYSLGLYERAPAAGRVTSEEFIDTPFGPIRKPGSGISLPGNLMADYILNPGDPVKALFVSSGNPVLSIGGEARMRDALEGLELMVSIDIYRNAMAEYAHYVLPAAGAFEREDINLTGLGLQFEPSVQYTAAVVAPRVRAQAGLVDLGAACAAHGLPLRIRRHPGTGHVGAGGRDAALARALVRRTQSRADHRARALDAGRAVRADSARRRDDRLLSTDLHRLDRAHGAYLRRARQRAERSAQAHYQARWLHAEQLVLERCEAPAPRTSGESSVHAPRRRPRPPAGGSGPGAGVRAATAASRRR